ncbi:MAG TPA: enoyl-CoA hydratase/isomerase family protein, partial [Streptosporangiaceae bacterium]
DVKVLVVTSAVDRFFAAGADIKHMAAIDATSFTAYGDRMRAVNDRLAAAPFLSVAAVGGLALGGGLELAMAATLRVSGPRARFGLPEVKLGLIPGAGGTQRLPRLVGRGRALDIMLTGRQVPAAEALAIGLADRLIGFLTAESRGHERLLLEGAVMHEDGRLDPVTDVRHDLSFDDGLDLRGGLLEVSTRDGAVYRIAADAAARGGYMSGGGYGGQHGRPMGRGHLEHDVYPLDGSVSPRVLDSALTDRLTAFTWDGTPGRGIFEFALTRSPAYAYQPTLA